MVVPDLLFGVDDIYRLHLDAGFLERDTPPSLVVHPEYGEFWLTTCPITAPHTYLRFDEEVTNDLPLFCDNGSPVLDNRYVQVVPVEENALFCPLLTAFKVGKSWSGGLIPAAVMMVPGVEVRFVGMEYVTTRNEFNYTQQFLFSEEQGLGLPDYGQHKTRFAGVDGVSKFHKNPDKGDMLISLSNGSNLECRTYKDVSRQEMLKGEEIDLYMWAEYYQFEGIEAVVKLAQNLEIRKGKNLLPTTPDRAHIEDVKKLIESDDMEWQGVFDVPRWKNPFAFSFSRMMKDQKNLTKQKWIISYEGRTGEYIGSTYNCAVGKQVFTVESHPELWKDPDAPDAIVDDSGRLLVIPENLDIPIQWIRILGCDTGTHHGLVATVFDNKGNVFFLQEFGNYRYVGGKIDRIETITFPSSCEKMKLFIEMIGGHWKSAADWNSQYKGEYKNVMGDQLGRGEKNPGLRTERTREFFLDDRAWFSPFLVVLPWEIERARYPDGVKGSPERVSDNDHHLDPAEHCCGIVARKKANDPPEVKKMTFLEKLKAESTGPMFSGVHPANRGLC